MATLVVLTALVIEQLIFAAASTLTAGMVNTLPASEPKLAGLPVVAELASVQVAAVAVKLAAGVSVIVTAVLNVVTLMVGGEEGVATPAPVVVMETGLEAKFVAVNVNGPPMAAVVIFCSDTVAVLGVFVNVHAIASP